MTDELLTPDNLTRDALHELFDAAYMDVSRDEEGDIVVREASYHIIVLVDDRGQWLRLFAIFGANPDATYEDCIAYANRVNAELNVIRAYVPARDRDVVVFDHYLLVQGGVSKKNVVLAVRRFASLLASATSLDEDDVLS